MYSASAGANFTFDDFTSAIAFVDGSGAKFEKHVPNFNASEILHAKSGTLTDVKPDLVTLLQGSALYSKYMLTTGELGLEGIKESTISSSKVLLVGPGDETKFDGPYWWGSDIYFNNAFANVIASALALGSGVAALAAVVGGAIVAPVAVIMGICSALLAIGSALFYLANAQGRGVYLRLSYIPPFAFLGSQ